MAQNRKTKLLRFDSKAQFERIRKSAKLAKRSLNSYMLLAIETGLLVMNPYTVTIETGPLYEMPRRDVADSKLKQTEQAQ